MVSSYAVALWPQYREGMLVRVGGRKGKEREKRERVYSEKITIKDKAIKGGIEKEKAKKRRRSDGHHDRRRVSGPLAEEGRAHRKHRGGYVKADETR